MSTPSPQTEPGFTGPPPGVPPLPSAAFLAGPQLLGSMLNFTLYGVLSVQLYLYHLTFREDSLWIKGLVYFIFIIETVQTAMNGADVWGWFLTDFGNVVGLTDPRLSPLYSPIMGSLVALVVQLFFCYRIFRINQKAWWLCILIALISAAQAVAGFVGGVMAFIEANVNKRFDNTTVVYIWLIGDAVADIMIAASMTFLLTRKTGFGRTKALIQKIVTLTIETNATTASLALLSLLLYACARNAVYFVTPSLILGKLYANTLLVSFNNRAYLEDRSPYATASYTASTTSRQPSKSAHMKPIPLTASGFQRTDVSQDVVTITNDTQVGYGSDDAINKFGNKGRDF